jgi:hypothetical protein
MYKPHEAFEPPTDEDIRIWRYFDFTKFVALLHSKALFFSRPKFLGDPFEGYYPPTIFRDNPIMFQRFYPLVKLFENFLFINCWHMNNYESDAMWKIYLSNNEGIAIQSTYNKLKYSFREYDSIDISLGKVKYIDYHTESFPPELQAYLPFLHKRREFSHEFELRAIALKRPSEGEIANEPIAGINLEVDLSVLIEKIVISPYAPNWFMDVVYQTIKNFGFDMNVVESKMSLATYITVNVTGAVNAPSEVTIPTGSTVLDAINAAGGVSGDADIDDANNLNMVLEDKSHIHAPSKNDPKLPS